VSEDLQVGPTSFTVARTVSLASSAEGQSLCTSGATALTGTDDLMVRIEVSVTWSGRGSYSPVRLVELAGMPDGLSVGTGALVVVRVVDPTHGGAGVVGATVELRSNNWYHSVAAGTTDQDGCAIARVPSTSLAGSSTYTAVATKPGYVSQSWTATTASTIGKPGYGSHVLVNRVTLGYAPSATLRVHITTEDGTAAASDQEVSGSDLTVLCSSSGTAASAPGWTATLSGAVLEIPAVWPCTYSAYLGDEVPATMTQVQVDGSVSDVVDIWVRPGYGIVSDPTGLVVPSPAPSTAEPTPAPSPTPTPTSSPETEEEQPAPEPSASATAGVS
jgi:hypothetical protein